MKSIVYTFRVIIEPDEPSGYHGFVPLLKAVHSQGETIEEVKRNLKEAIICHLQGLLKNKEHIPQESEAWETIQSISDKELVFQR
ncbi:MAG: type II toxin-antitoxin system HicB family antitoxin [Patescibacteria group bacterium]